MKHNGFLWLILATILFCTRFLGAESSVTALTIDALHPMIEYGRLWANSFTGSQYATWTRQDKIDALTNRLCGQNALAGAGLAAIPGVSIIFQVPAGMATSLALQVSLVAAVATVRGYDVHDGKVILLMFLVLGGDAATEGIKAFTAQIGTASFAKLLKSGIGPALTQVNRVLAPIIGKQFVTIAGTRSMISLTSIIPIIGPIVSFVVDGGACLAAAKSFDWTIFRGGYAEQALLRVALDAADMDNNSIAKVIADGWDTSNICRITPSKISALALPGADKRIFKSYLAQLCE